MERIKQLSTITQLFQDNGCVLVAGPVPIPKRLTEVVNYFEVQRVELHRQVGQFRGPSQTSRERQLKVAAHLGGDPNAFKVAFLGKLGKMSNQLRCCRMIVGRSQSG